LEGQWSDDFHHAVHVNVSGETTGYYGDFDSLAALAKVLKDGFLPRRQLLQLPRAAPRPAHRRSRLHPAALVVCSQNHDQIGNRATGDRLSHRCHTGSWRSLPC
jgi:maltooligosyltrehalose trehalohydrolase